MRAYSSAKDRDYLARQEHDQHKGLKRILKDQTTTNVACVTGEPNIMLQIIGLIFLKASISGHGTNQT